MSVVLNKSTNFAGVETLPISWSFFLVLPLFKYFVLSNKVTFNVWFCAEQSSLSVAYFSLQ